MRLELGGEREREEPTRLMDSCCTCTNLLLSDDAPDRHGDGEQPGEDHGQREYKLHGLCEMITLVARVRHLLHVRPGQRHSGDIA